MHGWIPILIMLGLGAGFGAVIVLGPVKFYLVAMIFLLFDIEIAFLYPFAMALRELRWTGYIQVVLFFLILLSGYIYVWRKGVFDWGHER